MSKNILIALLGFLALGALSFAGETPAAAASDTAVSESKRATSFSTNVSTKYVATHPQIETSLGIKTHNDQWNDISDEAAKGDLETSQKNLAELKRLFPRERLDQQVQLSCDIYEFQVQRDT